MLLRDENGFDHEAVITTNHAASSYGVPVLVVEALALGPVEAGGLCLTIVSRPPR